MLFSRILEDDAFACAPRRACAAFPMRLQSAAADGDGTCGEQLDHSPAHEAAASADPATALPTWPEAHARWVRELFRFAIVLPVLRDAAGLGLQSLMEHLVIASPAESRRG